MTCLAVIGMGRIGGQVAFLAGTDDPQAAVRKLWHPALRLLVITLGKAGCRYATPQFSGRVPGFEVKAVDTTGAGDGFVAGLLKGLVDHPQAEGDEAQLRAICRYANAVVTPLKLGRTRCPASVVIGREDLRAKGGFALWISPQGLVAHSVREIQGERPWSVGMGSVKR